MATSRRGIEHYPKELFVLFERAINGELVSIELASFVDARNFRGQLYAFRDALFSEKHELAKKSNKLKFKIEGRVLLVVLKRNLNNASRR